MDLSKVDVKFKLVLALLGLAILAEVIWAVSTYINSQKLGKSPGDLLVQTETAIRTQTGAKISLQADKTDVKVGEFVNISVVLSSPTPTYGVDLILKYDPNLLKVVPAKNGALAMGSIYSDVPINSADDKTGVVTVSGITSSAGGVTPNGLFGKIILKAVSVGKARVSVDFTPKSTIDSNVTAASTSKDILEIVENVDINIAP